MVVLTRGGQIQTCQNLTTSEYWTVRWSYSAPARHRTEC